MRDSLRVATPDDAASLAGVHVASWRAAYAGIVPEKVLEERDVAYRTVRLRTFLASAEAETYIAEQERRIAGFMTIGPSRDRDDDASRTGEIWGIYLHPSSWRMGIGTTLCRAEEEILCERGLQACTLWVLEKNDVAQAFYRAMGFRPDGATKGLTIGVDLTAIRYRKRIA